MPNRRRRFAIYAGVLLLGLLVGVGRSWSWAAVAQSADMIATDAERAAASLKKYRGDLDAFRNEYGGSRDMPDVPFFHFGMGSRAKYVYKQGLLARATDGKEVYRWDHMHSLIVPPDYLVSLTKNNGQTVRIVEDEKAVWINRSLSHVLAPSPWRIVDRQGMSAGRRQTVGCPTLARTCRKMFFVISQRSAASAYVRWTPCDSCLNGWT